MAEYYNKHRHTRPHVKRTGTYKPRSMRKNGVFIKIVIALLLTAGATFGVLLLMPYITGGKVDIFAKAEPTPVPTPTPKQTAHPIENANMNDVVRSVTVTDSAFQWFSDGYVYGETLLFTAGEIVNGDAFMTALFQVSVKENASTTAQRINIILENDHVMYPVFNDTWLVYLDAKASGGGKILCAKYGGDYGSPALVKEVYTGYPALFLSGDYLAWTERTGTSMDKLYVCDLRTMETSTVQTFSKNTYYGVSKPYLCDGKLVWADVDTENANGGITSQIAVLDIETGEFLSYKPDMFVHDPKANKNGVLAWLTGNHGPDSDLYVSYDMNDPVLIAKDVVDFCVDDDFIAYQKDENVFVYILSTQTEYQLNRKGQCVQITGASGGCVTWSDVTSHESEIYEFAVIPK